MAGLRWGWDLDGQTSKFALGAIDLLPQLVSLWAIQLDGDAAQAPAGPAEDRRDHLQIARHFGEDGGRRLGFALPLGFQKQLRLLQNALADGGRSLAPSGVQLPGFAAGEPVGSQRFRQRLAVGRAGSCHWHQDLHRDLGRNRSGAHLLLHAFGQ
jgi:hypothetical protein